MSNLATGRTVGKRKIARLFNGEGARFALQQAEFGAGREVFGFNGGQFSVVDLLDAVLEYSGLADCIIATWTAAGADMARVEEFIRSDRINSLRWIVDRSFQNRQPDLCQTLRAKFGDDTIRVLACHAKFMLVSSDDWKIVIQTSMNLNKNARIESFWICEDPELYAAYLGLVEEVFEIQAPASGFEANKHVSAVHRHLGSARKKKRLVKTPWQS